MTKTIRNLVLAFVMTAGTAGTMAAPALAAEWDHDRDGRAREWRHTEWREHDRDDADRAPYAYAAPAYSYAVPAYSYAVPGYGYYGAYGYAAPPVAYAPPAASFSLTIPFR